MRSLIKKIVTVIIPETLKSVLIKQAVADVHAGYESKYEHANISYSQEGEDLVLERIFGNKAEGFFVDIGAHHPKRFSNTYNFYLKGWNGINVDPMPGSMIPFNTIRPRDINLEFGIGDSEDELEYYIFNEPALNTFNKVEAERKNNVNGYFIIRSVRIKTYLLGDILRKYVPAGKQIDFISIDVEGNDLKVLQSNNWNMYRPKYVLVEELNENISTILQRSEISEYLVSKKYELTARTYNTSIYKADEVQ